MKKNQPRQRKLRRRELGRKPSQNRLKTHRDPVRVKQEEQQTLIQSGPKDRGTPVIVPEKGAGMWDRLLSRTRGRHRTSRRGG